MNKTFSNWSYWVLSLRIHAEILPISEVNEMEARNINNYKRDVTATNKYYKKA